MTESFNNCILQYFHMIAQLNPWIRRHAVVKINRFSSEVMVFLFRIVCVLETQLLLSVSSWVKCKSHLIAPLVIVSLDDLVC